MTTTIYTAHYDSNGEAGVIGAYTTLEAAQRALEEFYGIASNALSAAWEPMAGGTLVDGGHTWAPTWTLCVSDCGTESEYATVTQVQLG